MFLVLWKLSTIIDWANIIFDGCCCSTAPSKFQKYVPLLCTDPWHTYGADCSVKYCYPWHHWHVPSRSFLRMSNRSIYCSDPLKLVSAYWCVDCNDSIQQVVEHKECCCQRSGCLSTQIFGWLTGNVIDCWVDHHCNSMLDGEGRIHLHSKNINQWIGIDKCVNKFIWE